MGTRTVRFLGKAYSESGDVSIVATVDGNEVHNGTVPTTAGPAPAKNTDWEPLFQFDVDKTLHNVVIPTTVTVSNGTLVLVTYEIDNYHQADLTEFFGNWDGIIKTRVVIDGNELSLAHETGDTGPIHVEVKDGETAEVDWQLRELPSWVLSRPDV